MFSRTSGVGLLHVGIAHSSAATFLSSLMGLESNKQRDGKEITSTMVCRRLALQSRIFSNVPVLMSNNTLISKGIELELQRNRNRNDRTFSSPMINGEDM
ncbi:MAG: hypothetical protein IPG79_11360 [Saprospiraceae bacterium]|nr:hypothetical protein [Saprospiraceae bacterium]